MQSNLSCNIWHCDESGRKWNRLELTTDTPYLALAVELRGVYFENFWENWLGYNSTMGWVGAVRFLVVGTIGKEERPPRGQLWMEQYLFTGLSSTQYEQIPIIFGVWPFWLTPFFFSVNNILAGLWLNCITSVEITLFLLADILLQHRALFQCKGLVKRLQIHYVNWVFFSNDCQLNGCSHFFVVHF